VLDERSVTVPPLYVPHAPASELIRASLHEPLTAKKDVTAAWGETKPRSTM
jgi:hypothetical protein